MRLSSLCSRVQSTGYRRQFRPVAQMDPQEAHYKIDTKHTVKAGDDGSLWRYMVQHSYRPQPELDELQQVRGFCEHTSDQQSLSR